jgi:regulator of replication initiation timing
MARAAASVAHDLQPIDRLEDKIRQLVSMVETLRAERARAMDDTARLQRELDALRARLGEASTASAEVAGLREERELIRARVAQMIAQIDKLNL